MNNETTRTNDVLSILEDLVEGSEFTHYAEGRLREVYLHVEVMRQQSMYRTLERKHKLVDKLNRLYKKRLETVDADFAANAEAQQGDI